MLTIRRNNAPKVLSMRCKLDLNLRPLINGTIKAGHARFYVIALTEGRGLNGEEDLQGQRDVQFAWNLHVQVHYLSITNSVSIEWPI